MKLDYEAAMELTSELMAIEVAHRITVCLYEVRTKSVKSYDFSPSTKLGCRKSLIMMLPLPKIKKINPEFFS